MKRRGLAAVSGFLVALAVAVHAFPAPLSAEDDPPVFRGKAGQYTLVEPPKDAPLEGLTGPDGKPVDLAAYRGKVVLLNFWATWCAPCIIEMPTLDRLQADLGGETFAVLTVALDRKGMETVAPFWKEQGYRHLPLVLDPKWTVARRFGVQSLPQTVVIDHRGKIAGYLVGPAEWDGDAAKALLRFYIDKAKT